MRGADLTLRCDTVTFHAVTPGRSLGRGFRGLLGELFGEIARVEIGIQSHVIYSADSDRWVQAVAWDGDVPMYVFKILAIQRGQDYVVGPFPLVMTVSDV